jgi:hypothetical protein
VNPPDTPVGTTISSRVHAVDCRFRTSTSKAVVDVSSMADPASIHAANIVPKSVFPHTSRTLGHHPLCRYSELLEKNAPMPPLPSEAAAAAAFLDSFFAAPPPPAAAPPPRPRPPLPLPPPSGMGMSEPMSAAANGQLCTAVAAEMRGRVQMMMGGGRGKGCVGEGVCVGRVTRTDVVVRDVLSLAGFFSGAARQLLEKQLLRTPPPNTPNHPPPSSSDVLFARGVGAVRWTW